LYSSFGGDPDLREIVDLFVAEMPQRVVALLSHLRTRDWDALRRTAHQIKGSAGSYGFPAISPAAGVLEDALRMQEPELRILEAVDTLIRLCQSARGGTPA
jgi:HPt (histidine-containing phosphotransfer) domain-containing protein